MSKKEYCKSCQRDVNISKITDKLCFNFFVNSTVLIILYWVLLGLSILFSLISILFSIKSLTIYSSFSLLLATITYFYYTYQDLKIKMTAPSDWRELSRAEVTTARYANAGTLKSGQIYADYDIYLKILQHSEDEADEMLARLKMQKLEDLKLQVLAQNPQLLGIGIPGAEQGGTPELGTDPGGPNTPPDPSMGAGGMPPQPGGTPGGPAPTVSGADETPPMDNSSSTQGINLPEPEGEDIKKYDLEIMDYESDQDKEPIDYSIGEE